MIANYFGFKTDLNSLRKRFSVSSHGTSLQQLHAIAAKLNLSGRALQVDLSEIKQLQLPCIVHWDLHHFVVLKSISKKRVVILDPGSGELTYSILDFSKHFTGIALELTPTPNFEKVKDIHKLSLAHFWSKIFGI
jgi:ATP-binding cassette subfamily B protein RaxB